MHILKRFTARLLFVALATYASSSSYAQNPSLNGPRVVTLPYIYVPFLRSEIVVRQGVRDQKTGGCTYSLDLQIKPGDLQSGEKLASIQRAHDPDTCQELVERGVVLITKRTSNADSIGQQSSSKLTLDRRNADTPLAPDSSAAAVTANHMAFVEISYTDGNNPVVKPLRSLTDGIEVSHGNMRINLTTGDCVNTFPSAFIEYETEWFVLTGWFQDPPRHTTTDSLSCSSVVGNLSATHSNSSSVPLFFDCSDRVNINYSPLTLTLDFLGGKRMSGSVTVTGDMTDCGEFLARFMTLE